MVLICLFLSSFSLLFPFLVLCLCPNPHFHFLHRSSINLFQPLPLPSASSSGLTTSQSYPLPCFSRSLYVLCLCPDLHSPSLPLAIFLHLELSLFCLFSIPRPSVNPSGTPSLSYLSFSSGLSISPRFTRSCFTSPILFPFLVLFRSLNLASPLLLLGAVLLCSRCSARRKYSLFAPPLDMAKEAICALLAILGHFFEAFSPLDLFFALAPFQPASSASPCFPPSRSFIDSNLFHLPPVRSSQHHPGLVPIPLGDIRPCCLHLPSFCRLVSPCSRTSLRFRLPVSAAPSTPASPAPCAPGAFSLTAMISESPRA